jgi:hypothetical protein
MHLVIIVGIFTKDYLEDYLLEDYFEEQND